MPQNREEIFPTHPETTIPKFREIAIQFDEKMALAEAERCLRCKNPQCRLGCPAQVDIPNFIARIKEGRYDAAAEVIKKSNNFPSICGRVCYQSEQCEKHCILAKKDKPVAIGALERFIGDYLHRKNRETPQN